MDPLKSFEKKLLSGSLIDTTKLKQNRPLWLDPNRLPRIYSDLEALVTVPNGADVNGAQTSLDTAKVYQVLLASGLPQQILASIWDQCSKSVPGCLIRHEFYQALALVALCQAGNPPNVQLLTSLQNAPIPQLAIAGYPVPPATAVQAQPNFEVSFTARGSSSCVTESASQATCSAQQISSSPSVTVALDEGQEPFNESSEPASVASQPVEDEDDFADFQSAPSNALPTRSVAVVSTSSRISVPEPSSTQPFAECCLTPLDQAATNNRNDSLLDPVSVSHIIQNSTVHKSPKTSIVASVSPKQVKLLPSASLFDSITIPVTENVQPPSENSPWLGFSLEPQIDKPMKRMTKKDTKVVLAPTPVIETNHDKKASTTLNGNASIENGDEEFDDFDDFQSAPVNSLKYETPEAVQPEAKPTAKYTDAKSDRDKYSVFRLLDESPDESVGGVEISNGELLSQIVSSSSSDSERESKSESSTTNGVETAKTSNGDLSSDILTLMKLPSIPPFENTLDNDLSQFDSLSLNSSSKVSETKSMSALIELQDLDIGFTAVDGPVASHPSSAEVSPAKSAASGQSIGESRGKEHPLSMFTSKGNYAECASLSSFELGPSTESNDSSPTKGSVVSLELNSRSPPDDENGDEDDTLEWTIESGDVQPPPPLEEACEKQRRNSPEFCWAQPPMFPPPDPTDSEKTSALLNTGLFLQNFPETQKKKVTRQQVADGWHRILSKAAAILESASLILGNDPVVLGEILSTSRGQAYIESLLEVYNVTQQLKKSAELHGVEGLSSQVQQVDGSWRGKLDDLATRLHLSVVCMDHLSSPIRAVEDICAICSLPLNLRLPQILFGDNGYHSSCANFWANVLAEGLPCLKLAS